MAALSDQPGTPLPWGQVVESDQVWSAKTSRWYVVRSTVALPSGKIRVKFEGVGKPFEVPADADVQVRRGPTGDAVDMFVTVLRSG
jgi:hypothetical protein